jgi:hypothetical protein
MPDDFEHLSLSDRAPDFSGIEDPQTWDGPPPDSNTPPPLSTARPVRKGRDSTARMFLGLTPKTHRGR